jgi:hypothetical protein
MADINEVFREDFHGGMNETDQQIEDLDTAITHTHAHQHAEPHDMAGLEGVPDNGVPEGANVSQEDDIDNDIIENSQPDMDFENENVDNEEIELPDTENIESFYGNSINSEDLVETNETNFNIRNIALYLGIPLIILIALYFAWPKIKAKLGI